jgi:two-component system sensor histidine kinase AgrC
MEISLIYLITKHDKKEEELLNQKLFNKLLEDMLGRMGEFKHNFDNIVSTMSGYIEFGRFEDLAEYLNEIGYKVKSTGAIDLELMKKINEPGITALILTKLQLMQQNGVCCYVIVDEEISIKGIKISDLCDLIGILIDNAFEAVIETKNGFVKITVKTIERYLIFLIENTVRDSLEIDKIFQKGWSTKGEGRGLGLWYVMNTIKTYDNVFLNTDLKENVLIQELVIAF